MGCCLSCLRLQSSGSSERQPLKSPHGGATAGAHEVPKYSSVSRSAAYFKNIIDDAQGKFLSTIRHSRIRRDSGASVDDLKEALSKIRVDNSKFDLYNEQTLPVSYKESGSSIVDRLSEPVVVEQAYEIDRLADEVNEVVASYMNIRIDEHNVVSTFKPVG